MIDSKAKADKELQVIASRFRELGYTPKVDFKSDGSGYEQNSKTYLESTTNSRGERTLQADLILLEEYVKMMNDDSKPLHYVFKNRYRVSFIVDIAHFERELDKKPHHIVCCFKDCLIYVSIPKLIYGISSQKAVVDAKVKKIQSIFNKRDPSTLVKMTSFETQDHSVFTEFKNLYSLFWCPIICSNINNNLEEIDKAGRMNEFSFSRQSLFNYFTNAIVNNDQLSYIEIKDKPGAGKVENNKTYLHELKNKRAVKVPKVTWYDGSPDPDRTWTLDLITDWWIWSGQSEFKGEARIVEEADQNALIHTLHIYDGGQEFFLEPDWKPTSDDTVAAQIVEQAKSASAPAPPAPAPAPPAPAPDPDSIADSKADQEFKKNPRLRRKFLNRLYEFREPQNSNDCSGYWHGREDEILEDGDIYCTTNRQKIQFYKKVGAPVADKHLYDITYPSEHPLCGNIKFRPPVDGATDGEEQIRFAILFKWDATKKEWKAQLSYKEKEVKLGGIIYTLYRTPLGIRAYRI